MNITIYNSTLPALRRGFAVLSQLLRHAEGHATDHDLEDSYFLEAKLAPDMKSLIGQIQCASDTAKAAIKRLTGKEVPAFADTEVSFAELHIRIEKTLSVLDSVNEGDFAGSHERQIVLNFPKLKAEFNGVEYLQQFVLPNFYFHVTTAYDILRQKGLDIGKMDFLDL